MCEGCGREWSLEEEEAARNHERESGHAVYQQKKVRPRKPRRSSKATDRRPWRISPRLSKPCQGSRCLGWLL